MLKPDFKLCCCCEKVKPVEEFYLKREGLYTWPSSICRPCDREKSREWRQGHLEYTRVYDRRRYYEKSDRHADIISRARTRLRRPDYLQEWRTKNPEKYDAQTKLNNAVRDGKVFKPDTCSRCSGTGRVIGHHHDYSEPLDVIWLCAPCHGLEHRIGLPTSGGGGTKT